MNDLTAKRNENHFNSVVKQAEIKVKEDILELEKIRRTDKHANSQTAAYLSALLSDYLEHDTTPLALVTFGLSDDDITLAYRHAKAGGVEERPFAQLVITNHTPDNPVIPSAESTYVDLVQQISEHLAPLHLKMLVPYLVFMSRGSGLFQITDHVCDDTVFRCTTQGENTALTFEIDLQYLAGFNLNDIAFAKEA